MDMGRAVLLRRIAERYGTPTYVYDLDVIEARVARLRAAFPEAELLYAVKANPCGAVLQHLAAAGLGAEVITVGELFRARRAGFSEGRLLLGGPRQDAPLIEAARGVGWVSLDSPAQWRGWRAYATGAGAPRFLLRLNPGLDPRTHEHLATGAITSKFGMPLETVAALGEEVGEHLAGFHVHIGSQITDLGAYEAVFAQLTALLARFPHANTLDLGGGFAVPGFPLEAFSRGVQAFLGRVPGVQRLMLEPGRFLVAESGVLLTRVLHVKEGRRRHVIADAGMAELLRPALYGAQHPVRVLAEKGAENDAQPTTIADLDGPLCENADRLAHAAQLPAVTPGTLLAVEQAGAYGLAMASNYASSLRPAEVTLQGGVVRLARRREGLEDLVRLER
jgi:diaminopimelate decarboxylase